MYKNNNITILKVYDLKTPFTGIFHSIIQVDQMYMAYVYECSGKLYGIKQCADLKRKMSPACFGDKITILYDGKVPTSYGNDAYIVELTNHDLKPRHNIKLNINLKFDIKLKKYDPSENN